MPQEQIAVLKKALELYAFTIEQRREGNWDVFELNDFYEMTQSLSELLGVDFT